MFEGETFVPTRWKILKATIENATIAQSIKNNIIGELWTRSQIKAWELKGYKIFREVQITNNMEIAKADAVAVKGNEMIVLEFKSMDGKLSEQQAIIYPILESGQIEKLRILENVELDIKFKHPDTKVLYKLVSEAALGAP
ncbi:MAG: hypothetical protein HC880_03740 [Bacteroidia bacterium]|nr:hypothetical protein [Bacteroidia bacterium]